MRLADVKKAVFKRVRNKFDKPGFDPVLLHGSGPAPVVADQ
jgi:hypothetical protein